MSVVGSTFLKLNHVIYRIKEFMSYKGICIPFTILQVLRFYEAGSLCVELSDVHQVFH
jgi:hypothetical protein